MVDDAELLRRYVETKDEEAFAELVRRYLDLVYSAALRRLAGDAHSAADVTQLTFASLARHALTLVRGVVVPAWLYGATRNIAVDFIRSERRRRAREAEAQLMNEDSSDRLSAAADWQRLRPLLDEAMDELGARDRDAVVLRFFAHRSFAEIGRTLGLTEDAARMRVDRALEKLRVRLGRRGVTSTAAGLALVLVDQAVVAAPTGMAASVAGSAMASTAASVLGAGIFSGCVHFMSTSKVSVSLAGLALVATFGGALREIRASQRSDVAVAAAKLENEALADRLRVLRQQREAVNVATQTARKAAPGETPQDSGTRASVEAETNAYLARHPELREALRQQVRATAAGSYAMFFRTHGLSQAQIERFLDLAGPVFGMGYRFPGPGGTELLYRSPADARGFARRELQAILGEEGFRDLIDLYETRASTIQLPAQLAGALYPTGTPLTPEQADRLQRILRDRQVRPDPTSPKLLDWNAVISDAVEILTEPQMKVLRHIRTQEETYETLHTVR